MSSVGGGDGLTNDDDFTSPLGALRERVRRLNCSLPSGLPLRRFVRRLVTAGDRNAEPLVAALEDWVARDLPEIDFGPPLELAETLAQAWLGGSWELDELRHRTAGVLNEEALPGEFESIVRSVYFGFGRRPHWRREATLVRRLMDDPEFMALVIRARILALDGEGAEVEDPESRRADPEWIRAIEAPDRVIRSPAMSPGVRPWPVPRLATVGELARFLETCGIDDPARLVTTMDPMSIQEASRAKCGRYHRYWRGRRLIEAPGPILSAVQRAIAASILRCVPAHEAAHGFCPERSVLTAVRPHVRRHVVMVVDLEAFFPSIVAARVHGLFQALGYPECVARALSDLCTTKCLVLPERRDGTRVTQAERARFGRRHVPSGAPTSPDLANRIAYRLDCRLSGLSAACDVRYTRYADDLIFSGETDLAVRRFLRAVERIVSSEGFIINSRKTRIMTRSVQQRVLGLVLNDRPRIPRRDFENLQAWLFNLARDGVEAQDHVGRPDLREHLTGRVAWVRQVEPERAGRLEDLLARIAW